MSQQLEKYPQFTSLANLAIRAIRKKGGRIYLSDFEQITGLSPASCDIAVGVLKENDLTTYDPKTGILALTEQAGAA